MVFKHFPLDFHKHAHLAAQASLAANAEGKFWEYHALLFDNQQNLTRPDLEKYAGQLKLDMNKFRAALDQGTYKEVVDTHVQEGKDVGVQGTPTSFINGRKVEIGKDGPEKALRSLIEDELERVKEYKGKGLKGNAFYNELLGIEESGKEKPKKYRHIAEGDSPTKGDEDAPVTLVEFSDFLCGFCAVAARAVDQVVVAYKGKVRVVFKQFPLSQNNFQYAHASLAAHQQGKFWEYQNILFANQQAKPTRTDLIAYAKQLELDVEDFIKDMDSPSVKAQVEAERQQGVSLGVDGTPKFFINNRPLGPISSFDGFQKEIDKILLDMGYKKEDLPTGPPPAEINIAGAPSLGPSNAPVTIAEFSNFT